MVYRNLLLNKHNDINKIWRSHFLPLNIFIPRNIFIIEFFCCEERSCWSSTLQIKTYFFNRDYNLLLYSIYCVRTFSIITRVIFFINNFLVCQELLEKLNRNVYQQSKVLIKMFVWVCVGNHLETGFKNKDFKSKDSKS